MGDEALLPPRLFRARIFTLVNVINFVVGIGIFGGMILLPLYLQIVKGLGPTAAGLMLVPQTAAIILAGRITGPIVVRTGSYKGFLMLGVALVAVSAFGFSGLGTRSPLWQPGVLAAVMGLGIGMFFQVVMTALQDGVPARDIGVASGLFTFFRQIGGTAGVAVLTSVLFDIVGGRIAAAIDAARATPDFQAALDDPAATSPPVDQVLVANMRAGTADIDLNDTSFLNDLDPRLSAPILEGMSSAISTAFLIVAFATAIATVFPLALGERSTEPQHPGR